MDIEEMNDRDFVNEGLELINEKFGSPSSASARILPHDILYKFKNFAKHHYKEESNNDLKEHVLLLIKEMEDQEKICESQMFLLMGDPLFKERLPEFWFLVYKLKSFSFIRLFSLELYVKLLKLLNNEE